MYISTVAQLLTNIVCSFLCAGLVLQIAAPMPVLLPDEGSGSGEQPVADLEVGHDHRIQLLCDDTEATPAPAAEEVSTELPERVGSLERGLDVFLAYAARLRENWGDLTRCRESPVSHKLHGYRNLATVYITDEKLVDWVGVFRAYGDHISAILELPDLYEEDRVTMETLYSILTAVLEDYKEVMEPFYCECANGCFNITEIEPSEPTNCDYVNGIYNMEYWLTKPRGDITNAMITVRKWRENRSIEVPNESVPSREEWVRQNVPLNAPDLSTVMALV